MNAAERLRALTERAFLEAGYAYAEATEELGGPPITDGRFARMLPLETGSRMRQLAKAMFAARRAAVESRRLQRPVPPAPIVGPRPTTEPDDAPPGDGGG